MDAKDYFDEYVEPTVIEALEHPDCKRRVAIACIMLTHMADHLVQRAGGSDDEVRTRREEWNVENASFGVVNLAAVAVKHVFPIKEKSVGDESYMASGASLAPLDNSGSQEDETGELVLADSKGNVQLHTSNDRIFDLIEAIEDAVEFVRLKL
jgi:hypothetical protein